MAYVKGAAALTALNTEAGASSGSAAEFTRFSSGTTLKVKVQGVEDLMQYYGYGLFKPRVNTFVAKNPSKRNDRGYVEADPTPWDLASQYYYDQAREAENAGASEDEVKALRDSGYMYSGKERYAIGFHDLTEGKDIVVDFTKLQAQAVYATIEKYKTRLDRLAFELSKTGASRDTKVTLMPLIDLDEDLTETERKHFEAAVGKPFNHALFDGLLYEMDEKEQVESLVAAGFDISLIGYTIGAAADDDEVKPIGEGPIDISDDDLPF